MSKYIKLNFFTICKTISISSIHNIIDIHNYIYKCFNLHKHKYYLVNTYNNKIIYNTDQLYDNYNYANSYTNYININIIPRVHGGNVLNSILKFIFKIFDPIVKPLRGIAQAVLMLLKGILYMALLLVWIIKFFGWFLTDFVMSFPTDILTLIKRIVYIIYDTTIGIFVALIRKGANKAGNLTLNAVAGWDNVPEADEDETKVHHFKDECNKMKCYRTSDGTIPFSVIISTILCPPIGVFMEYGITGWFNILICTILTLMFYFPGLIYGLILLYC